VKSLATIINEHDNRKIAVTSKDSNLNYRELKALINQLSNFFDQKNTLTVCIFMPKGISSIIAISAVLSYGQTLWVLDSAWPTHYLTQLLSVHTPSVILTTEIYNHKLEFLKKNPNIKILTIETLLNESNNLDCKIPLFKNADKATLISVTSGTTGLPKLVSIPFRALYNSASCGIDLFKVQSTWNIAQLSSFSFDASIFEILLSLIAGSNLCIPSQKNVPLGKTLGNFLIDFNIQLIFLTPTILSTLPIRNFSGLKSLVLVGEKSTPKLIKPWLLFNIDLYNAYGTTETAIMLSAHKITSEEQFNIIGKPISNTEIFICDKQGNISNDNVGELYVKIDPEIKYISNKKNIYSEINLHKENIFFNTQDVVMLNNNKELIFLYRSKQLIKVNGVLINPLEITNIIERIPNISRSILLQIKEKDGIHSKIICLYTTEDQNIITPSTIKTFIGKLIPKEKIPAKFIQIDSWPMNNNGKIDILNIEKKIKINEKFSHLTLLTTE